MDDHLDPIRYEMFTHRLYNIAEEGRIALQKVCASPIVVQGGECMSAFYDSSGTTILSASGHLRFCAGCADAVLKCIEWYEEDPGIFDGDQFFFNDPYIASTHVFDMMIIKPIFYEGRRIAWTGSMTHTADTGGVLRGAATEIYHEGIRIMGLKVMEKGKFRTDIFKNLVEQCRDPDYVALDIKSRIASNNVCAKGFLQLIEKYGIDFVGAASRKIIADSEKMARARLRSLPDGAWRSRLYGSAYKKEKGGPAPFKVACTMTKKGDQIQFDFSGTSPQNADDFNATLAASWGQLYVALSALLFWNIPWNGGMVAPVKMVIPEGTLLNCKFPAACGHGPMVGMILTAAASECISKMLYAGGNIEDVNASWYGGPGDGGPGLWYGGRNQHGGQVGQGIYDMHGSGFGAAPYRDGVSSGGHMNNPTIGISDVEMTEMNYPFIYLCRNHRRDSGGYGKFRGGLGPERLMLVYGSNDLTTNFKQHNAIVSGWGMFGGYPVGDVVERRLFRLKDGVQRLKRSEYPGSMGELDDSWGEYVYPRASSLERIELRPYDILAEPLGVGSGFGDPLDRDPEMVLDDLKNLLVSIEAAQMVYGVVIDASGPKIDMRATAAKRASIREERLKAGVKRSKS